MRNRPQQKRQESRGCVQQATLRLAGPQSFLQETRYPPPQPLPAVRGRDSDLWKRRNRRCESRAIRIDGRRTVATGPQGWRRSIGVHTARDASVSIARVAEDLPLWRRGPTTCSPLLLFHFQGASIVNTSGTS